ncbi:MAG: hypothetical protein AB7I35_09960 [Ramlibacter sp.]
MTSHSLSRPPVWLAGFAVAAGLGLARAQTPTPPATAQAALHPAAPPAFRSALEDYQPYTDEKTLNWKEANDLTARIGGWRAYAREAQQPAAPGGPVAPDPHAGHHMPEKDRP